MGVAIRELSVECEVRDHIATEANLNIEAAWVERACSRCVSAAGGAWWKMTEAGQSIRFHNKQPAASDVRHAVEFASAANSGCPKSSSPTRPEVLLVFSANKSLEVDTPDDILRLHEIQCGKRNSNCGCPALLRDAGFRCPHAIPARIAVSFVTLSSLFFGDYGVPLGTLRINLEHVCVAPIVGRIDDDFEGIVEPLRHITPQLVRHDLA